MGGRQFSCTRLDRSHVSTIYVSTKVGLASHNIDRTPTFTADTQRILSTATIGALEDLGGYGNLNFSAADIPPSDNNIVDVDAPRPLFVGSSSFVLAETKDGVTEITYTD